MIANLPTEPRQIDWEAIRARLGEAGKAIDPSERFSPQAAAELLARRARALEQPPSREPPVDEFSVVAFSLGQERYAIEAEFVRKVERLTDFTPVAGAPPMVTGVINHRGEIVAIVDLRMLLGIASPGLVDMLRVIMLGAQKIEFGLLASRVVEFAALRPEQLLLRPPGRIGGELVKCVTRDALIVLDGRALLAEPRLYVNKTQDAGI